MPLISLTRLVTNFKVRNMLEEKPPRRYGIEGIWRLQSSGIEATAVLADSQYHNGRPARRGVNTSGRCGQSLSRNNWALS